MLLTEQQMAPVDCFVDAVQLYYIASSPAPSNTFFVFSLLSFQGTKCTSEPQLQLCSILNVIFILFKNKFQIQ